MTAILTVNRAWESGQPPPACLVPAERGASKGLRPCNLRRRAFVLEVVLFFACALLIDWLCGAGDRFWGVDPHPFWIIILLAGVQYGTTEGILAASCATAILLAGNVPPQKISQDMFEYWLMLWRNPMLWLSAALLIGEFSRRHQSAKQKALHDLQELHRRHAEVLSSYQVLEGCKEELEHQVASELQTTRGLIAALQAAQSLSPQTVLKGALEIVRYSLRPRACSVFLMRGEALELYSSYGWKGQAYRKSYGARDRLYQEIVEKRFLCCADPNDEGALDGHGVLAGPLSDPSTGRVWGAIKIEAMDFTGLNPSTVAAFEALCRWLGLLHANAQEHRALEDYAALLRKTMLVALQRRTTEQSHEELAQAVALVLRRPAERRPAAVRRPAGSGRKSAIKAAAFDTVNTTGLPSC